MNSLLFSVPVQGDADHPDLLETDACAAALISGYALRDSGLISAAEQHFRQAVALMPTNTEALAALGDLLADDGRWHEAAEMFECAAAVEPNGLAWLRRLAEAHAAANQSEAAAAAWRRFLEHRPDSAPAHRSLGHILAAAGRNSEAIEHLREALFLDSADRQTALELAGTLIAAGDALAAAELLQPYSRRNPDVTAIQIMLARAWLELGERDKALAALRRSLAIDPEDVEGAAVLIARIEDEQEQALGRSYVRALFDRYADRFDQDLTVKLKYTAPQALRSAVDRVLGSGFHALDILDLGCGTGLAGVDFRPLARRLCGVDLAPRMIEKARQRGLYDYLEAADLNHALDRHGEAWDLIVAADVLVYLGDLAPVIRAAATALRPGGLFAATTERHDGDGFALGETRRYSHSPAHIRHAAEVGGLEMVVLDDITPRWEKGQPVSGLLFVMRKPL